MLILASERNVRNMESPNIKSFHFSLQCKWWQSGQNIAKNETQSYTQL